LQKSPGDVRPFGLRLVERFTRSSASAHSGRASLNRRLHHQLASRLAAQSRLVSASSPSAANLPSLQEFASPFKAPQRSIQRLAPAQDRE
jgi:hypothetical protein